MPRREQILSPERKRTWDPAAAPGQGVNPRDYVSRSSIPNFVKDAVVAVQNRDSQVATGTLLKVEGIHEPSTMYCVLTCAHVLQTREMASQSSVVVARNGILRCDPSTFLYLNEEVDLALCALSVHGKATLPVLCPVHWSVSWMHLPITVLHHPNAAPLTVTTGRVVSRARQCFYHTADTLPGSSGGPVFVRQYKEWHLVGMHGEAVTLENNGHGSRELNSGCTMDTLLKMLKRKQLRCVWSSLQKRAMKRSPALRKSLSRRKNGIRNQ